MRALAAALMLTAAFPTKGQASLPAIEALLVEAAASLDAGRPVDTLRVLRKAQEIDRESVPAGSRGAVLVALGDLYVYISDFERAKRQYGEALALLEKSGDADRLARALNGLAAVELVATRYAPALALLERAQALEASADARSASANLLAELRARGGDLAGARELATRSRSLAQGRIAQLRAAAQGARLAARAASYREALELWEGVLARARALGAPGDAGEALASLGELYLQLGLAAEAKARFEEGLKEFLRVGNRAGEARVAVRLSRIEQRLHRPDLALAHAERGLALARKRHDYVTEAEALVELGEIWSGEPIAQMSNLPNETVAVRHLRAAREIYKDAGDRGAGAGVWLRTAAIQLRLKQHRTAGRAFEFVAKAAQELGDEELYWQAVRGEAAALAGEGALEGAVRRYEEAIAALERVYARTAGLSQEARSSFLGDRRGIYEEYVEVLIRLRGKEGGAAHDGVAFAAAERAKSRQFSEMLSAGGAERAAETGDAELRALAAQERAVRGDLTQVQRAIATPGAQSGESAGLANRMAALRGEHDAVMQKIGTKHPRYAELLQPRPVSVAETQAVLRPGEVLLSFFVGRIATAAFVITRERFAMVPMVVPRRELRASVDRFRRPFAGQGGVEELARWNPADAHALYQRIVEPVTGMLPAGSTLLIAGDDALYTLPFEALLRTAPAAPEQGKVPFAEMQKFDWFGDHHPIAYIPSAGALRALRGENAATRWQTALVAFADPDFGTAGVAAARGVTRSGDAALARLPETADEVRAVSAIVKGASRVFLQRDATESRAREAELASARYVMFSTHGLLGGEISAVSEPALALSLVGNPPGVDGFLSMSEVLGLRLTADLVALSACNTAGEPDAARIGEGFAGLTRSFMYAGARSLVVSHWPVGSQATVALMTAFFRELAAGRPKPVALANARKALRSQVQQGMQLAHPFFWAPFVLVGESN